LANYPDMNVSEFLKAIAGVDGLPAPGIRPNDCQ
jgi:hypothetical protein